MEKRDFQPVIAVDFDAYANPYVSLSWFWLIAQKSPTVIVFGTDGLRQSIKRSKVRKELPSGKGTPCDLREVRLQYNFWWKRFVLPFVEKTIAPYRIVQSRCYTRKDMLYWGIVVQHGERT